MRLPDHYGTLGVGRDASLEAIKRRFRELARTLHPDVAGDDPAVHERFIRLSEAYQVLSDANGRANYNLMLRDQERLREVFAAQRPAASTRARQQTARPS